MKLNITDYKNIVGFNSPLYNITDYTKFNWLSNNGQIKHNLWDEQFELGYFNNDGSKQASSSNVRTKNDIAVKQNSKYYFKKPVGKYTNGFKLFFLDNNKGVISTKGVTGNESFDTPNNCSYIKFYAYSTVTSIDNDIYIYQVVENEIKATSIDTSLTLDVPYKNGSIKFSNNTGSEKANYGIWSDITTTFAYGDYMLNTNFGGSNYQHQIRVTNSTKSIVYLTSAGSTDLGPETYYFTLTPANYTPGDLIRINWFTKNNTGMVAELSNMFVTKIDDSNKWEYLDLGSLTYIRNTGDINWFATDLNDAPTINSWQDTHRLYVYATGYTTAPTPKETLAETMPNDLMIVRAASGKGLRIRNDSYTTVAAFNTAMSGKILMYEKNWATVDLGSLNWNEWISSGLTTYYADIPNMKIAVGSADTERKKLECNKFLKPTDTLTSSLHTTLYKDKTMVKSVNTASISIRIDSAKDADDVKDMLSGVILIYQTE